MISKNKTTALGIFESPGEFGADSRTPGEGLPEVDHKLFDILSFRLNHNIIKIEEEHANGFEKFVPESLQNLINPEDNANKALNVFVSIVKLASYAQCFVIADKNMGTLYVNFQVTSIPDAERDKPDFRSSTYTLLYQLAGVSGNDKDMINLAFCALNDQNIFAIALRIF